VQQPVELVLERLLRLAHPLRAVARRELHVKATPRGRMAERDRAHATREQKA